MWPLVKTVAIWLFGDKIFQYALYIVGALLLIVFAMAVGATNAIMWQPFGQWWLAGQAGGANVSKSTTVGLPAGSGGGFSLSPGGLDSVVLSPGQNGLSVLQRAQLAQQCWSGQDLVIAVAVSMAEDPSGDPAQLGAVNPDGSRDLGLWQINQSHWAAYGGQAQVATPAGNLAAACDIQRKYGWLTQWTTYRLGTYLKYMQQAQDAVNALLSGAVPATPTAVPLPSLDGAVAGIIQYASQWLGTPYLFGGCSPKGIDCSCFVQFAYASQGIQVPRTTVTQQAADVRVPTNAIQPGDTLFFDNTCTGCGPNPTHEGLVVSTDPPLMYDCGDPCKVESYVTPYWSARFDSAGRPRGL